MESAAIASRLTGRVIPNSHTLRTTGTVLLYSLLSNRNRTEYIRKHPGTRCRDVFFFCRMTRNETNSVKPVEQSQACLDYVVARIENGGANATQNVYCK